MKTYTLTVVCSRDGCESEIAARQTSTKHARDLVREAGWRLGAVRDICPSCYSMGHRP